MRVRRDPHGDNEFCSCCLGALVPVFGVGEGGVIWAWLGRAVPRSLQCRAVGLHETIPRGRGCVGSPGTRESCAARCAGGQPGRGPGAGPGPTARRAGGRPAALQHPRLVPAEWRGGTYLGGDRPSGGCQCRASGPEKSSPARGVGGILQQPGEHVSPVETVRRNPCSGSLRTTGMPARSSGRGLVELACSSHLRLESRRTGPSAASSR